MMKMKLRAMKMMKVRQMELVKMKATKTLTQMHLAKDEGIAVTIMKSTLQCYPSVVNIFHAFQCNVHYVTDLMKVPF